MRGLRRASAVLTLMVVLTAACSDDATTTAAETTTTTTTLPTGPVERYAGYESVSYADDAHWLCRPGRTDICASDLDTTIIAEDGTLTVEPFAPAADPPIDCFYVYPTISRDPGANSDWNASDAEEGYAALNQAARLRSQCRVFAPIYRQRTLASLASRVNGGAAPEGEALDPYVDVLDAWKTYMANDNDGRGIVLVGHSQGAALLSQLIAEEIDPNDDVRAKLVSAFLAGSAVRVPEGADVGGAFQNVPLCRDVDQVACVVTWASFRSTAPPEEGALFGRPRAGEGLAACNNPASLTAGSAEVHSYFSANRTASILASVEPDADGSTPWLQGSTTPVTTPFVSVPGLVTAECVTSDGFSFLSVTVHPDPSGPRADDIGGDLTRAWASTSSTSIS